MSERPPEFSDTDPRWVRIDALRAQFGIKHAQMQRIRKQLGNAFEYGGAKPGKPVWVYFPLWIVAWHKLMAGDSAKPESDELRGRSKQEFYDGERAELRYRKELGELVPVEDVAGVFTEIGSELSIALTAVQRISPESCDRFVVALDSAKEKIANRFRVNGHSHANGTATALRPGRKADRDSKAVSSTRPARVRRARGDRADG